MNQQTVCETENVNMYRFNHDDMYEWVIARNLSEAIGCYISSVGHKQWEEERESRMNPASLEEYSYEEFIGDFITELEDDDTLTMMDGNEEKRTLTIKEHIKQHLDEGGTLPVYFGCSGY
ncbi:hypothetical protein P4S91_22265 [Aneurinibacillus aneurinilyticus]|jgi:hypothetical protein|uniref:hypothetical protein n=1 Tax=Aneurinibacillus aneurinilyticus TaxID=1391 RepID=UPI002E207601|nr:hypothetical protein [Aneurinibacillus aneurinilyticus]MED0725612.1 hypothetical protein [Aneurinibacillus aneurinilyticus]